MAYSEELAERLRARLKGQRGVTEKKMFGGLAFLLNGNMCVAASGRGGLLARVDPEETRSLLAPPNVALMKMGGRTMAGWIRVASEAIASDPELGRWVERCVAYTKTLPRK